MGKLFYFIAAIAALWLINSYFGFWIAASVVCVVILIRLWAKRADVLVLLASRAYFINGDVEKGEKYYKAAYKTGLMTANGKMSYSSFCLRENRFDKGRRLLNEIINSSRTSTNDKINAKHNLAVLIWKEGDLDEATRIIDIVHKEMPSSKTYGTLGVFLLEKAKRDGNYDAYLEFMLEAYDYNSDDKTIADNLGELYLNLAQYDKAKEVYDSLLQKELLTPMPYYNYGIVLKNLGDREGAAQAFRKALTRRFTAVLTVTKEMVQAELEEIENTTQK